MSNNAALFAIAAILLLMVLLSSSFSPPFVTITMAQQIALTPEELEQQRRLQNVIAATTRNLEETEKQVNGIVYTPRWSNPVWVEADSLSILFVYCLPGEFAESGQEILGGSQLEVLESYALALTGDLMVWFAVVENEDEQNRLPAAVGVICASDLNQAEIRVLSPQEQQEIDNIIQQFITIQNTQITNIENVINIINNVTTNGTTTGPVTPPPQPPPTNDTGTTPPTNDTGGTTTEEQPLTAEIIPNATQVVAPATIKFDSKVTGGTEPYNYRWELLTGRFTPEYFGAQLVLVFQIPGIYTFILTVTDSNGQTASDSVQFTVGGLELPPSDIGEVVSPPEGGGEVLLPPETGQEGQSPGGGLLSLIPPPTNDTGGNDTGVVVVAPEPGGVLPPPEEGGPIQEPGVAPPTVPEGGGDTGRGPQGGVTVERGGAVNIYPNATTGYVGDNFELIINIRGLGEISYYIWCCTEDGSFDSCTVPRRECIIFTPSIAGTLEVSLLVRDSDGNRAEDSVLLTIKERPQGGAVAPEPGGVAPLGEERPPTIPEPGGVAPPEEGGPIPEPGGGAPPPPPTEPPTIPEGEETTGGGQPAPTEEPPTNDTGGG